jgi:hypothetical protein
MLKRYELIRLNYSIFRRIKLDQLVQHIQHILDEHAIQDYFLTFELTYFFANCVNNMKINKDHYANKTELLVKNIEYIYNKIVREMPPDKQKCYETCKIKITNDVNYILKNNLLIRINSFHFYSKYLYNFFFQQNIYIVEKI